MHSAGWLAGWLGAGFNLYHEVVQFRVVACSRLVGRRKFLILELLIFLGEVLHLDPKGFWSTDLFPPPQEVSSIQRQYINIYIEKERERGRERVIPPDWWVQSRL